MEPTIGLTTLIFVCMAFLDISTNVCAAETHSWLLARHRKPIKLTTKIPLPNKMTVIAPKLITKTEKAEERTEYYHPAAVPKPRLIERYDKRSLDGPYEYRYVLSNGDVRYERAYWQTVGHIKVLARMGFYSYPLPNHRFHTVYYTADHNGFQETQSTYSRTQPNLPGSLEIPTTNVLNEKSEPEKKDKKKTKRKLNWTPLTTTILQKGRVSKITQEINPETKTGTRTRPPTSTSPPAIVGMRMESEASTAIASLGASIKTSTSNVTNRSQINIAAIATTTESGTVQDKTSTAGIATKAINPVKAETVQTATVETKTETAQLNAIDTATVLSVD